MDVFLRGVKHQYAGSRDASTLKWIFNRFPTLVWLHEPLQWSPSFCMEVICLVGVTVSVLGVLRPAWRTAGPLALLWFCYLSIVQCGQTFMQFQWDSFLLEVGVLAVLLAPWWQPHNKTDNMFETPAAAVLDAALPVLQVHDHVRRCQDPVSLPYMAWAHCAGLPFRVTASTSTSRLVCTAGSGKFIISRVTIF